MLQFATSSKLWTPDFHRLQFVAFEIICKRSTKGASAFVNLDQMIKLVRNPIPQRPHCRVFGIKQRTWARPNSVKSKKPNNVFPCILTLKWEAVSRWCAKRCTNAQFDLSFSKHQSLIPVNRIKFATLDAPKVPVEPLRSVPGPLEQWTSKNKLFERIVGEAVTLYSWPRFNPVTKLPSSSFCWKWDK